ncbi:MAG: hypothetical protein ACLT98_12235 [Eggerthellaceae bacterium]
MLEPGEGQRDHEGVAEQERADDDVCGRVPFGAQRGLIEAGALQKAHAFRQRVGADAQQCDEAARHPRRVHAYDEPQHDRSDQRGEYDVPDDGGRAVVRVHPQPAYGHDGEVDAEHASAHQGDQQGGEVRQGGEEREREDAGQHAGA